MPPNRGDHVPFNEQLPETPRIELVRLTAFRNYSSVRVPIKAGACVLTGENGVGKTNFLEALSLLAPGMGLRRQSYDKIAQQGGDGSWAVAVQIATQNGLVEIGTGLLANSARTTKRRIRINHRNVIRMDELLEHLRIIWLTPRDDRLFSGPASERREFLDRFVLTIDALHHNRLRQLERALRQRNYALRDPHASPIILDSLEEQIAAHSVAIASSRNDVIAKLQPLIRQEAFAPLPWAKIALDGLLENWLHEYPATMVEDNYLAVLRNNRARDSSAGRTLAGVHLSNFIVTHGPKAIPGDQSSTGEQKALLIRLVLSYAMLVSEQDCRTPILLLDEITAHLDQNHRQALFDAIGQIACQTFMTGIERSLFAKLEAQFMTVCNDSVAIDNHPPNDQFCN